MIERVNTGEREAEHEAGITSPVRDLRTLRDVRDALREQEMLVMSEVASALSSVAESLSETAQRLEAERPSEWMTSKQAAKYLSRSETAFANIVASGEIPKHYLTERGILFNRREVDDWLMDRTAPEDCL